MKRELVVYCSNTHIYREIKEGLASFEIYVREQAESHLLVDIPRGWWLSPACCKFLDAANYILIATDNPCLEYRLALLERFPNSHLCGISLADIAESLFESGREDKHGPKLISILTPTERLTLHLIAKGYTPKRIAGVRKISEGRVKNTVGVIYQKLGLDSRVQLALYYYGLWHVLEIEGWEPPRRALPK